MSRLSAKILAVEEAEKSFIEYIDRYTELSQEEKASLLEAIKKGALSYYSPGMVWSKALGDGKPVLDGVKDGIWRLMCHWRELEAVESAALHEWEILCGTTTYPTKC